MKPAQRQNRMRQIRERREARGRQRFIEPLTAHGARKVSKGLAKLEFGPTEREVRSQVRGSRKREGELGRWYGELGQGYDEGGKRAQEAFGAAEAATNQRLGAASQRAQETLKGLSEGDASFAALVGGPRNSSGLSQAAEAAAAAERTRAAAAAPLSTIRADYVASYAPRANAARLKGIEARQNERERRRKLQQDLGALKRERGAGAVKSYLGLREQDQTAQVQRAALGTKENYNKALNLQSRLGYKGRVQQAQIEAQATALLASAKRRGATAQEEVARLYSEGKGRMAKALENVAHIQGKNQSRGGGYGSIQQAESMLKEAVRTEGAFKSPGEAVDYLNGSRSIPRGVAKRAVHNIWRAERRKHRR